MNKRKINGHSVNPIGLGCMNLSHAYGSPPSDEAAINLLHAAIDLGVEHFDTAALYGFGKNEALLGKALAPHRDKIFLASKCGMAGVNGKRVIDGRPQTLRSTIEASLTSLNTEVLDLYYLHRMDKSVPIEESVGELSRLVGEGKIKAIGLSEVSAESIMRANSVHSIAAVQTEYSLWTRNPEIAVLETCKHIGAAFIAFSPLARGFLTEQVTSLEVLVEGDIRRGMPRFNEPHFSKNKQLLSALKSIAQSTNLTLAQLCLAWVLHQGEHVHVIPGTQNNAHLADNVSAEKIVLSAEQLTQLSALFSPFSVSGPRYPEATQAEIETEEF
jgi:aryl-alcohol dehydrogenase-like predicted oxidoreductase